MKGRFAVAAVFVLVGCGSNPPAADKSAGADRQNFKPETGKLSELHAGGGSPKGAGTGSKN